MNNLLEALSEHAPYGRMRSSYRSLDEVEQYDNLFLDPDPDAAGKDFLSCLNPNSLEVLTGCKVEASLANAKAPASYHVRRDR